MMPPTEEDFELELRSLPGVLNVGMGHRENGDVDTVTLIVHGQDPGSIQGVALQIASLYYPDAVVTVEGADLDTAERIGENGRVALVRAAFDGPENACEVQVNFAGRIGTGRSVSGPLIGGVEATLAALRDVGFDVPFYLIGAVNVATERGWPVMVTLRSNLNDVDRIGIAQSDGDLASAAKATLDALNRYLSLPRNFRPHDS
jgi:hypothetical protein